MNPGYYERTPYVLTLNLEVVSSAQRLLSGDSVAHNASVRVERVAEVDTK